MDIVYEIDEVLRKKGYSSTKPRRQIFELLQRHHKPLSVIEINARLFDIDKVTVYRTIDLFEKIGIAHRIWNGFKSKIELGEEFSSHHHHFTCQKCGTTMSLSSEDLEKSLKTFESVHGFKLTHHSVELSGYCKNCRS